MFPSDQLGSIDTFDDNNHLINHMINVDTIDDNNHQTIVSVHSNLISSIVPN